MEINRAKVATITEASVDGRIVISPDKLLLYGNERWGAILGESDFNLFEWLKSKHKVAEG